MLYSLRYFLTTAFLLVYCAASAQYTIHNHRTTDQFKEKLQGEGIEIIDVEILCKDSFLGTYSGVGELGINDGVVLSINHTDMIFPGYDSFNVPHHFYGYGTSYYRTIVDTTYMTPMIRKYWYDVPENLIYSYNSCALSLNFIPFYDSIKIDFVFTDAAIDITHGADPRIIYSEGIGLDVTYLPFRHHRGAAHAQNEFTLSPRCDIVGIFLHDIENFDTLNLAVYPGEDVPVNYYSLLVDTPYVYERGREEFFEEHDYIYGTYPGSRVWWSPFQHGNRSYWLRKNTNGELIPSLNYGVLTNVFSSRAPVMTCDTQKMLIAISTTYNVGINPLISEFAGSALFVSSISSFGSGDPTDCNPTSNSLLGRFEHVVIYPNPATDQVTISGLPHNTQVFLADVMGRSLTEVQSRGSSTTIHTADYPAGVYFLQFKDDAGHTGQAKFVIGE